MKISFVLQTYIYTNYSDHILVEEKFSRLIQESEKGKLKTYTS